MVELVALRRADAFSVIVALACKSAVNLPLFTLVVRIDSYVSIGIAVDGIVTL